MALNIPFNRKQELTATNTSKSFTIKPKRFSFAMKSPEQIAAEQEYEEQLAAQQQYEGV